VALLSQIPLLVARKEEKKHGMGGQFFGGSENEDEIILIDDVVSTGGSVVKAVNLLRENGYKVSKAIVLVDRLMGGAESLKKINIDLFTVTNVNKIEESILVYNKKDEQLLKCKNLAGKRLVECAKRKKSKIIFSADIVNSSDLLNILDNIGKNICCAKLHSDSVIDFNQDTINSLLGLSKKHDFLLMEDRKLADIGSTMEKQLHYGNNQILKWADLITVHGLPGSESILYLSQIIGKDKGLVLIGQMSSSNNMFNGLYTQTLINLVYNHSEIFGGIVCQERLLSLPIPHLCPGIKLTEKSDNKGQKYRTPKEAFESGIDFLIVGRDIYQSEDIEDTAKEYQVNTWF
jgi:uridine monophosphate synthetase